jgi:hypothetical protein
MVKISERVALLVVISLIRASRSDLYHDNCQCRTKGSVSKVEMATPMALIYIVLFPSVSTFETPPSVEISSVILFSGSEVIFA